MIKAISYGAPSYRKDEWDINNTLKLKYYKPDLAMIKDLGATHVRVYDVLPSEFYMEAADQGLQIIQQLPGIYYFTNFGSLEELHKIMLFHNATIQLQLKSFPIYAYVPWNDMPYTWVKSYSNVVNKFGEDVCNQFIHEIIANLKTQTDVPIMSANLMNSEMRNMSGDEIGFADVDIIGINAYLGITDWVEGEFDINMIGENISHLEDLQKKYNKQILLCETGYSSFFGEDVQASVLSLQAGAALRRLGGVCIFEFADEAWKKAVFPHEKNWGLVSENRQVKKKSYQTVKDLFNGS